MSDFKFASLWASLGLFIGFLAFAISFWFSDGPIPGYWFFAGPGVLTLQMFSEEVSFWPKLGLLLAGQYFICFALIFSTRKVLWNIGKYRG